MLYMWCFSEADSDEDDALEETNIFYTETGTQARTHARPCNPALLLNMINVVLDVSLPSNLARSSSWCVRELKGRDVTHRVQSGAAAVHVYQEMMHIYEKLQVTFIYYWHDLCSAEESLQWYCTCVRSDGASQSAGLGCRTVWAWAWAAAEREHTHSQTQRRGGGGATAGDISTEKQTYPWISYNVMIYLYLITKE